MTDLIDRIGPFLGIAAFLGLAILAFLVIQQAREIRRLREWAGRAPERKDEATDAVAAAAEARGEEVEPEEVEPAPPSRIAVWFAERRAALGDRFAALDRRLPVDPRYFLALLAAGLIAVGVLTGGFGLLGGETDAGGGGATDGGGPTKEEKAPEVSVLNATQEETVGGDVIAGVPGLAGDVAKQVVKPAGFRIGAKADAASGFEQTAIMFEPDHDQEADDLAAAVADQLGETEVSPMIGEVRDLAEGAPLALVIGKDDADFGS